MASVDLADCPYFLPSTPFLWLALFFCNRFCICGSYFIITSPNDHPGQKLMLEFSLPKSRRRTSGFLPTLAHEKAETCSGGSVCPLQWAGRWWRIMPYCTGFGPASRAFLTTFPFCSNTRASIEQVPRAVEDGA